MKKSPKFIKTAAQKSSRSASAIRSGAIHSAGLPPVRLFVTEKSLQRIDSSLFEHLAKAGFGGCLLTESDDALLALIGKGKFLVGVSWNHPQRHAIMVKADKGSALARHLANSRLGPLLILPDFDPQSHQLAPVDLALIAMSYGAKALTLDLIRTGIFGEWLEKSKDFSKIQQSAERPERPRPTLSQPAVKVSAPKTPALKHGSSASPNLLRP